MSWRTIYLVVFLSISISTLLGAAFAPIARNVVAVTTLPPVVLTPDSTQAKPQTAWTMVIAGDIMLDRDVHDYIKKQGDDYPWRNIKNHLVGDVVVANLEGPMTSHRSVATTNNLVFTFDPALAPSLKSAGLTTLSLANNHTLNFGQSGLDETRQTLTHAGLQFFGDPSNRAGFISRQNIQDHNVTFIGYMGLVSGLSTITNDVSAAHKRGDTVIVMAHWGNEYNLKVTARQTSDAHALIDAGADMIIGAHPHVVEPVEIYKGKFIAYSLGNLVFDQYFSYDTQQGLLLNIMFEPERTKVTFVPLDITKSQPKEDGANDKLKMLDRIASTSMISDAHRVEISSGVLTLTP